MTLLTAPSYQDHLNVSFFLYKISCCQYKSNTFTTWDLLKCVFEGECPSKLIEPSPCKVLDENKTWNQQ